MPKRTDIRKIMLIGSGPIVIGQGCEFDYSGVQACKALKKEGFEIVLVNSNPATIMTDPEFADRTYIEPLTVDSLHEIIRRERPDALLPTLGGQTALNLAMALDEAGVLRRYKVEMIGAKADVIRRAEDRQEFKAAMKAIGLDLPRSGSAHSMDEALAVADAIGSWPLIIRPGFTLGGTGGGIAHGPEDFREIAARGLAASHNSEILVEESLLGWKEMEMEVIRDSKKTAVIVCSIENFDPMGVHTGDSITVAPAQTLTDAQYQLMRDETLRVMEAIGIESGGSNVQWAINPQNGRMVIIEMNPRVSRSSALASKATGFPIAKVAALLAAGYTLDELSNDITRATPACFEPAVDYVVVKAPRFTFEKFPGADTTIGTQMKSVGEAMAIGRTFEESFQKALRSLETGRAGFGADGKDGRWQGADSATLEAEIARPNAERVFALREALARGATVERLNALSGIDPFFLRKLEGLVKFEAENFTTPPPPAGRRAVLSAAKKLGYSDRQIAFLLNGAEPGGAKPHTEMSVRALRKKLGVTPCYGAVDTCAGAFEAATPYYYSAYAEHDEPVRAAADKKKRIMILGGGPNRIGQGIEFDYCCCHASFALREAGCESIMLNSNPETVSTDFDTSDKLYFEPLTLEDVMNVYERERCDGVIVQFGGQTPLNLAQQLKAAGANVIGTDPDDIDAAEDRDFFKRLVSKAGISQPPNGIALTAREAEGIAEEIGYPVLVRPSFVLGGRAMVIVHDGESLRRFVEEAMAVSDGKPILIDRFLEDATELDVDCVSDGKSSVVGAVMEHVELAGIHSGDSACSIPTRTLSEGVLARVRKHAAALARELHVKGLMNIQFAVRGEEVFIIEVNPRASRTVPFVGKVTGVPLAKIATRCMLGSTLKQCGFTREVAVPYSAFKEAVFPFVKFRGVDVALSPEMKSTGEVMGIDISPGAAYLKSQMASGNAIPENCGVLVSFKDTDKTNALPLARKLSALGFQLYATRGTATMLYDNGIKCAGVYRVSYGRPNVVDLIREGKIKWIVNTPESGSVSMTDEVLMRTEAVAFGIPITTTLNGLQSALEGLDETRDAAGRINVCSLQEYHRMLREKNGMRD